MPELDAEDDEMLNSLLSSIRANPEEETPMQKVSEIRGIVQTLMALGATADEAKVTVAEVYSPPRVTAVAGRCPRYGVLPGGVF